MTVFYESSSQTFFLYLLKQLSENRQRKPLSQNTQYMYYSYFLFSVLSSLEKAMRRTRNKSSRWQKSYRLPQNMYFPVLHLVLFTKWNSGWTRSSDTALDPFDFCYYILSWSKSNWALRAILAGIRTGTVFLLQPRTGPTAVQPLALVEGWSLFAGLPETAWWGCGSKQEIQLSLTRSC